jgi:hypothetical protein
VLDLPVARAAAIARAGSSFHVAVVDEAGGVVVETLDRDGGRIARVSLAPEPPATVLVATASGAVVARADQTLALVDWGGAVAAQLATDAGERIVELAGNGRDVIASVDDGLVTRVKRVIVGDRALRWGDAVVDRGSGALALSPSGDRVAMLAMDAGSARTVVTDRAGRVVFDVGTAGGSRLGFVDEDHVAVLASSAIYWVDSGEHPLHRGYAMSVDDAGFATGSGVAIAGLALDLAVSTRDADSYLGYGMITPSAMAAGSAGVVMVAGDGGVEALDASLAAIPARRIALPERSAVAVQHLVGDDWFVETSAADGVRMYVARGAIASRVDVGSGLGLPVVFEPSTRLLALSGSRPRLFRYEPGDRTFTAIALPRYLDAVAAQLMPTDRNRAGGAHLVIATDAPTPPIVTWYGDDYAGSAIAAIGIGHQIYVGADRSGRAFLSELTPKPPSQLLMYARGELVGQLPFDRASGVAADPITARIATLGAHGVTAYDSSGRQLWHRDLSTMALGEWLDDDALAVPTASGVVRFAGATGAVTAARCGWRFGRTARPHPTSAHGVSVCADLAHQ